MTGAKTILLLLLAVMGLLFVGYWIIYARRARTPEPGGKQGSWSGRIAIGILTDFFDTLGVGSFATTTSLFRLGNRVHDENIPGTLNVGHALPTLAQAFIYIAIVQVDMRTLGLMIAAAVAGAFLGAGIVVRWPRRNIQLSMGLLMIAAALIIVIRQLRMVPDTGIALGLQGGLLAIAIAWQFCIGRVDDPRHWTLRTVYDPSEPARNESPGGLSHHDGLVRLSHAGCITQVHSSGAL